MQDLDVGPGTLETAATLLRAAYDDGATRLARAIVDDLVEGCGDNPDVTSEFGAALPQLVDLLGQHVALIGDRLSAAVAAYRRADWIARVAAGGDA